MVERNKERILGLPKNIFFLGLTSLFNDFSSEMVFAAFPAFFTAVLHAGAASLGIVDGVAEAASNFFKIYSGNLSDKIQRRKALVVSGYSLSVLTRPFYALVSTVGGALGLRFLDRVGKGLRDSPRDAIISLSTPKEELGRSFGYHRAMDTIGGIVGPLLAFFLLLWFPLRFNLLFMTAFVIGVIAVLTLFFVSDITLASPQRERPSLAAPWRALTRPFKWFLVSTFVLSAGSLPVAVLLLKTRSIGLVIADIPLFYVLYSVSYAGFSISAGKMSDRVGARTVIVIGYCVLLLGYVMLGLAETPIALAMGFLVLGLFPALTDGVQRSLASQLSAEELRGGALGLLNAATGLGALVAGAAGGYLWQTYGPSAAFVAGAAVIAAGLTLFAVAVLRDGSRLSEGPPDSRRG